MFFRVINGLAGFIIFLAATATLVMLGLLVLSNGGIDVLGLRGNLTNPRSVLVGPTPAFVIVGTPQAGQQGTQPAATPRITAAAPLNSVIPKRPLFKDVPLPQEVSRQPEIVLGNLFLAILFTLALGATAAVLNTAGREQGDRFRTWVQTLRLGWLVRFLSSGSKRAVRNGCLGLPIIMIIFALYGIIFAFLEKGINIFSPPGVQLAIVMAMSVGLVSLGGDVAQRMVGRVWRSESGYGVYPANLIVAVLTTLLSRTLALSPGVVFGVPGGADVTLSGEAQQIRLREIALAFTTLATVIFLGALGWGATGILAAVGQATLSPQMLEFFGPVAQLVQTLGLAVFAVAIQTAFFEMLPLSTTLGNKLFRWNSLVWGFAFIPVMFLFAHTLLNPFNSFLGAFQTANVRALTILTAGLLVITLFIWLYIRLLVPIFGRRRPVAGTVPTAGSAWCESAEAGMTQPMNRSAPAPQSMPYSPDSPTGQYPAVEPLSGARPTVIASPRPALPTPVESARPTLRPQNRPVPPVSTGDTQPMRILQPVQPPPPPPLPPQKPLLGDTRPMQPVRPDYPTTPLIPDVQVDPYDGLFPPAEPGEDEDINTINETYLLPRKPPAEQDSRQLKTTLETDAPAEADKDSGGSLDTTGDLPPPGENENPPPTMIEPGN